MVSPSDGQAVGKLFRPDQGGRHSGRPIPAGLSPNGFVASPVAAKAGIPRMRPSPRMSRIPPTKRDSTWPRGSPASSEGSVIRAVFPVWKLHSVEQDKGKAGRFEFSRQGGHIPVGVRRTGIHPWNAALARIGVVPDRGRGPLDADFSHLPAHRARPDP